MASTLLGELGAQFFLLLFELGEFHFDEFVMVQQLIQGCKKLRTETFLADLEHGLQPLGLGLESADLAVGERIHCAKLCEAVPPSHEEDHRLPLKSNRNQCLNLPLSRQDRAGGASTARSEAAPVLGVPGFAALRESQFELIWRPCGNPCSLSPQSSTCVEVLSHSWAPGASVGPPASGTQAGGLFLWLILSA